MLGVPGQLMPYQLTRPAAPLGGVGGRPPREFRLTSQYGTEQNKNMNFSLYILVFTAIFLTDICWTLCIRKIAQGRWHQAAFLSALVTSLTAIFTVAVVSDYYAVIPATLGAYLGTLVTVKWDMRGSSSGKPQEERSP